MEANEKQEEEKEEEKQAGRKKGRKGIEVMKRHMPGYGRSGRQYSTASEFPQCANIEDPQSEKTFQNQCAKICQQGSVPVSFTAVGIPPISFTAVGISLVLYFLGHNMSFTGPSVGSGGRTVRRVFEFGRTYVVRPKDRHQATVVWLHGLGDNGLSWSQLLETLPVPNIKWICPTATQPKIFVFGCFPSTVRFDVRDLSEDAPDDLEGLDASAAHVANLLSTA